MLGRGDRLWINRASNALPPCSRPNTINHTHCTGRRLHSICNYFKMVQIIHLLNLQCYASADVWQYLGDSRASCLMLVCYENALTYFCFLRWKNVGKYVRKMIEVALFLIFNDGTWHPRACALHVRFAEHTHHCIITHAEQDHTEQSPFTTTHDDKKTTDKKHSTTQWPATATSQRQ